VRHPQRRMIVQLIHPRHRNTTRHRPGGARGRFHRTRAAVPEPFPLGGGKRLDPGLIHPGTPCHAALIVGGSLDPRPAPVNNDDRAKTWHQGPGRLSSPTTKPPVRSSARPAAKRYARRRCRGCRRGRRPSCPWPAASGPRGWADRDGMTSRARRAWARIGSRSQRARCVPDRPVNGGESRTLPGISTRRFTSAHAGRYVPATDLLSSGSCSQECSPCQLCAGELCAVRGKAPLLICSGAASRRGLPMGVQLGFTGGSTRWQGHLGRFTGPRLRCGDWRAAAGGCHWPGHVHPGAPARRARAPPSHSDAPPARPSPSFRPGRYRSRWGRPAPQSRHHPG